MTEYLVQHWNIKHSLWMNELNTFEESLAIRKIDDLEERFPHEKFRILKCEPIGRK